MKPPVTQHAEAITSELHAFVQGEAHVRTRLTDIGEDFIRETWVVAAKDSNLTTPSVHELDQKVWEHCIDSGQPTIGFRPGHPSGILALAAQRLRQCGTDICNVVILPEPAFGIERHDSQTLYTQRGVLTDATGQVFAGDFPELLQVDAVFVHGNRHLWEGNGPALIRHVNSPAIEELFDHKPSVQRRLAQAGIPHAEPLITDRAADDPDLHRIVRDCMETGQAIVIKPVDGSLGRGVIMADPTQHTVDQILSRIDNSATGDTKFMVEPRIQCPPLYFPETGVRCDWNVRVQVVNGEPEIMYARAGAFGEAINFSRGATPRSLASILDLYEIPAKEQDEIISNILDVCRRVGQAFPEAGLMGCDVCFDSNMRPIILEVNGERAGGLRNSMLTRRRLGLGVVAMWEPAITTVNRLHERLFSTPTVRMRPGTSLVDPTTTTNTIDALYFLDSPEQQYGTILLSRVLSMLSPTEQELARPFIDTYLSIADTTASNAELQPRRYASIHDAYLESKRRLTHDLANTADAYAPFNDFVRQDSSDLSRHRATTDMVMYLAGYTEDMSFIYDTLCLPEQTTANAEALGRALFLRLTGILELDLGALDINTIQRLEQAHAQYLLQPPDVRRFPIASNSIPAETEREYLAPLFTYIHLHEAINHGELEQFSSLLHSSDLNEDEGLRTVSALIYEGIARKPTLSPNEQAGLFFLELTHCSYAQAYERQHNLPQEYADISHDAISASIAQHLEETSLSIDEQLALLQTIMSALAGITSDDYATALESYLQLDDSRFPADSQWFDTLHSSLCLYMEERHKMSEQASPPGNHS